MGVRSSSNQEEGSSKKQEEGLSKKQESQPYAQVCSENVEVRILDARQYLLKGNASFHSQSFEEALASYRKGLAILIHDHDDSKFTHESESEIKESESESKESPRSANTSEVGSQDQLSHEEVMNYVEVLLEEARRLFVESGRPKSGLNSLVGTSSSLSSSSSSTSTPSSSTLEGVSKAGEKDSIDKDSFLLLRLKLYDIAADFLNNLGATYFVDGNISLAQSLYNSVLELRHVVGGGKSLAYAESLQNLASCYEGCKNFTDAEHVLLTAQRIVKGLSMEQSTEYTSISNNLGVLYSHMKLFTEAEAILTEVVNARVKALGSSHRLTQNAQSNLNILQCKRIAFVARENESESGRSSQNEDSSSSTPDPRSRSGKMKKSPRVNEALSQRQIE